MTAKTGTPEYTTCTGTRCYGLRFEGMLLRCPNCAGTALLYSRKPAPAVKEALLRQLQSGEIQALSSDGRTVYAVTLGDTPSCTCPAGERGRRCYHVATALTRYPAAYTAPWAVLMPQPDPEPQPPAPAVLRPADCQAALYPRDCPACLLAAA